MHRVHFKALDFRPSISDHNLFADYGYVSDLSPKEKEYLFRFNLSLKETDDKLPLADSQIIMGETVRLGIEYESGSKGRGAFIIYRKINDPTLDLVIRAHEESHAACWLGVRQSLERKINIKHLDEMLEEDFCDEGALYALRLRKLSIPSYFEKSSGGHWKLDILKMMEVSSQITR